MKQRWIDYFVRSGIDPKGHEWANPGHEDDGKPGWKRKNTIYNALAWCKRCDLMVLSKPGDAVSHADRIRRVTWCPKNIRTEDYLQQLLESKL